MIVNPIYTVLCKYYMWKQYSIVFCVQYAHNCNVNNFNTDNFRSLIHVHWSLNIWNDISQGFLTFFALNAQYLYIFLICVLLWSVATFLFQLE